MPDGLVMHYVTGTGRRLTVACRAQNVDIRYVTVQVSEVTWRSCAMSEL